MKTKLMVLSLILCVTTSVLISCTKNDLENTFYWDQTGCADPWKSGSNNSHEATASALKNYLKGKGIKAKDIEFRNNRQSGTLFCFACHCTTGIRILVVVRDKDIGRMTELGFQPY